MKANAMLIIEGTIAAILLYWVLTNPGAVNAISSAGVGAVGGGFKQLIGGGGNPGA